MTPIPCRACSDRAVCFDGLGRPWGWCLTHAQGWEATNPTLRIGEIDTSGAVAAVRGRAWGEDEGVSE